MRQTARAIIIQNKKVLLVTGYSAGFYWTPGGGLDDGETSEQALYREIKEELGVKVLSKTPYLSYVYDDQIVDNFLVETAGELRCGSEIESYLWYESGMSIELSEGFREMVLPRLKQDTLIT